MSFNPDKINIHELTIEEPEKQELTFDPERDLTPEDWEGMGSHLKECRRNEWWPRFFSYAKAIKILNPEKVEGLGIDEDAWQKAKNFIEKDREHSPYGFREYALAIKILNHKKVEELGLDEETWQKMENEVKETKRNGIPWMYLEQIAKLKILSKNRINEEKLSEFGVDENFTQKRIAELSFDPERNTWFSFAQNFVSMKILFPEKNIGSKLDAGAWKGMRDELENIRNSSDSEKWERLSSLAMNMKILAAEKVEVTDKGLEITMPEKREGLESAPALPETKQF